MEIETISLVYFSPVYHTRELARILGGCLADNLGLATPVERDITVKGAGSSAFGSKDLAIFAAPVYGGRIPAPALERMREFKGRNTPAIVLASYGNRAFDDALLELAEAIKECGFSLVAGAACIAGHTIVTDCAAGRPNDANRAAVGKFAENMAALLKARPLHEIEEPQIPGNRPYRLYSPSSLPQYVDDKCTHCGTCVKNCPVAAIDPDDVAQVAADRCICCMRCVNICPADARHASEKFMAAVHEKIYPLCSAPKENSFFGA